MTSVASTVPLATIPSGRTRWFTLGTFNAVVVGLLLMSPFGWAMFLKVGANYFPEIAIALIMGVGLRTSPQFARDVVAFFQSPFVQAWTVGAAALFMLGFLFTRDIFAAYSDFRVCLLLGYAISFVARAKTRIIETHVQVALVVSLVATAVYYTFIGRGFSVKQPFCVTGLLAAVYIAARYRGMLTATALATLGLYMIITSSYRSNFIVGILLVLIFIWMGLFPISEGGIAKKLSDRLNFVLAAIAAQVAAPFGIAYFLEFVRSNPSRYHQTVYKTTEALNALKSGRADQVDSLRASYIPFIQDNFSAFILPSGLGYKGWNNNWHSMWMPPGSGMFGSSIDGGHLYMALHLGIGLSCVLVALLGLRWFRALFARPSEIVPRLGIIACIGVFMSAFGGQMFTQVGFGLASGILFGLLCRK